MSSETKFWIDVLKQCYRDHDVGLDYKDCLIIAGLLEKKEEELQSALNKQAEEIFERQLTILKCCGNIIYGDTAEISGKYLMEMLVRGIFEGDSELHYDRVCKVINYIQQKYSTKEVDKK